MRILSFSLLTKNSCVIATYEGFSTYRDLGVIANEGFSTYRDLTVIVIDLVHSSHGTPQMSL